MAEIVRNLKHRFNIGGRAHVANEAALTNYWFDIRATLRMSAVRRLGVTTQMPVDLRTLAYTSQAVRPLGVESFLQLLSRAQRFNESVGVTGLLVLSKHVNFIQTLEGTPDAVLKVYNRIFKDPLHKNIEVFVYDPISVRVYPDSAMLSDVESAAPALSRFLRYALERKDIQFTAGQLASLAKTAQYLPAE